MAGPRFLLDANIFIPLEDPKVVPPGVAALAQKSHLHGISLFVDEACVQEVSRDRNLQRRQVTLSKLQKFPILEGIAHRAAEEQVKRFGPIRSDNDRCDVTMLDTLDL